MSVCLCIRSACDTIRGGGGTDLPQTQAESDSSRAELRESRDLAHDCQSRELRSHPTHAGVMTICTVPEMLPETRGNDVRRVVCAAELSFQPAPLDPHPHATMSLAVSQFASVRISAKPVTRRNAPARMTIRAEGSSKGGEVSGRAFANDELSTVLPRFVHRKEVVPSATTRSAWWLRTPTTVSSPPPSAR